MEVKFLVREGFSGNDRWSASIRATSFHATAPTAHPHDTPPPTRLGRELGAEVAAPIDDDAPTGGSSDESRGPRRCLGRELRAAVGVPSNDRGVVSGGTIWGSKPWELHGRQDLGKMAIARRTDLFSLPSEMDKTIKD
jgi:hypothetical protein